MTEKAEAGGVEVELDDANELVWRNVNPGFLDNGVLSSQAFRPTPKDKSKLSGARQAKVSAEKHFHEFTTELNLSSAGVWAVSVAEANAQDVRCVYDAEAATRPPDPCPAGHTYFDFQPHGTGARKRISRVLSDKAAARGCQHSRPEE
ncbi:hypothetical protein NONO_c60460 [Nocardia nova SH22a]|uniref:Uncharacterized protein n=1 Tax=Nocardia nova SH22a TaxID=1415166 RepID=W5TNJ5_9NOCA|nr:hypothetical protein [Nocardia nova]AHH20822.1 hypothetical protein NONO_c60460 [Nocardia nova SH22a]